MEPGATIKLPNYVWVLDPTLAQVILENPERGEMLLAAGIRNGELMLVTGMGEFKVVHWMEVDTRNLNCRPSDDGTHVVFFTQDDGKEQLVVSAKSLLKRAKDMGLVIGI